MPIFFSFKFLMAAQQKQKQIPKILKFWCIINCYYLISFLLCQILDENIFPIVNIIFLIIFNIPPYDIASSIYDHSIGNIYRQKRQNFDALQSKIVKVFNKKTEVLKNKIKDSTGQKFKGAVGDLVLSAINSQKKVND